ncbi:MAG: SEL1-like repeat protein [Alphaproteobacteria bacterium]|nr:SEL1-like repeat protein [Alphaproteobacteria bacterium]
MTDSPPSETSPRNEKPAPAPASGFAAPTAWRIDGIDPKVQSRAAQAAAEANEPLAEWLTKTINAAATARPASNVGTLLTGMAGGIALAGVAALVILMNVDTTPPRPSVAAAPPAATPPAAAVAPPASTPAQPPPASPVPAPPATAAPPPAASGAPPAPPAATATAPAAPPAPAAPATPPPAVASPAPAAPGYTTAAPLPPPPPPIDPNDPLGELKQAANGGDAAAQFTLGARYAAGEGVDQDWSEAFKWFKRAAESGMPTAQHNLAVMYERSRGTEQNLDEAAKWYEKAAEQGYPPSQYNFAVALARGWGVKADVDKAVTWFERAAERIPQANIALAEIFEGGLGVGRDLGRARSYYQLAATAGDPRAQAKLRTLTPEFVQRETIKEIQALLAKLRYNPGTPDGRPGQRTTNAIKEFQRTAGVPEDGKPTQALLDLLRSVAASG